MIFKANVINSVKGIICLILVLIICMISLAGCFDQKDGKDSIGNNKNDSESFSNDDKSDNDDTINDISNKEKFSGNITNATLFYEGYAFISNGEAKDSLSAPRCNICINEKGEIVFTLDGETDEAYTSFKNGRAMVKINEQICLIDTKGNIVVSPDTHGYTTAYTNNNAFYDGYFVVQKITNDFNGTIYEYGVINLDGTWKHELNKAITSSIYFGDYPNGFDARLNSYKDGILGLGKGPFTDFYWNLETNQVSTKKSENPLELRYSYREFYDSDNNVVLDVSEKYPTMYSSSGFYKGELYSNVVFHLDEDVYYFSLMDRSGELLFEPKQYVKDSSWCVDVEKNMICYIDLNFKAIIMDLQGNIKATFELPETETLKLINEGAHNSDNRYTGIQISDDGELFTVFDKHSIVRNFKSTEYNYYYFIDLNGNLIFQ